MVVWFDINLSDIELDVVCVRFVLSWMMLKEDSFKSNEPRQKISRGRESGH